MKELLTRYPTLFQRHERNPILSATDWPYPAHTVFNPGATLLPDGTTLLLCRVEDRRGHSHLCAARSVNGVEGWVVDKEPTFSAEPKGHPEELWGVEDPRITFVPELESYAVVYTAYGRRGPGVALATTRDFRSFKRFGIIMAPDDKDATLLPRRIDGSYALLHRPMSGGEADIWISYSPDLQNWGDHELLLKARRGAWWDANKVGLSPPLIETPQGWLLLYHGVRQTPAGCIYRLGLALLDLEQPRKCLLRGDEWIFGPEASYEIAGDVSNVVFPCGTTLGADGDTLRLYYGAADSCIAMATGSVRQLLGWLEEHGKIPAS